MQGKTKTQHSGKRKSRQSASGAHQSSIDAGPPAVFAVEYPLNCMEFGAIIIPEVMMKDAFGNIVSACPSSKEKGREVDDRRRRSRPTRASLSSDVEQFPIVNAEAPWFTISGAGTESIEEQETPLNYVIVTYEDEKKREHLKTILFKEFPIEDAHINALGKDIRRHSALTSITFKQSQLYDRHMPLLAEILERGRNRLVEISIDDNPLPEQSYYILLRACRRLEVLFLRGCKIDNNGARLLAEELAYKDGNTPCSLLYLNLSKNIIDDEGASALAKALRTNRVLLCLTLTGNIIGDDGALSLANVLVKFQLSDEEVMQRREVVKRRIGVYRRLREEAKSKQGSLRRKTTSPDKGPSVTSTEAKHEEAKTSKSMTGSTGSLSGSHDMWKVVDERAGLVKHPLLQEVWPEEGKLYSAGNLKLEHLNLSFNRINILGAQRFLQALSYQITLKAKLGSSAPTGLVNLVLHGNPIPTTWTEWDQMHEMLSQLSGRKTAQRRSGSRPETSEKQRIPKAESIGK